MKTWRYLPYSVHTGAENMAIDEAIMDGMKNNHDAQPVLRFYGWEPATLSLGYSQSYSREVNAEACRQANIDVVRRPTGGRAVLHQYELTYSVIVPESEDNFKGTIIQSYLKISEALLKGIKAVGVSAEIVAQARSSHMGTAACFDAPSWYELAVGGKKLVGSAQMRKDGILLQHGSIIFHFDTELLFSLLKLSNEEVRQRLIKSFKTKACALDEVWTRPVTIEELERETCLGFEEILGINLIPAVLTNEEKDTSQRLVQKYSSLEWTMKR
ncbi:lipoate--protein ligase family protein [Desulfosporosinus orientis]|nr:biotin/lipoate A/B protein ligase family protein [Desulfosporosinus orientis]